MDKGVQNAFENVFHSGKSSMIHIREFNTGDLGRVYEIEHNSFNDPYHPLFLLNLYELYSDTFLVALENETVSGFIIARIAGSGGHIIAIAVDPEKRNKGIGKVLLERIMTHLKNLGAGNVWLEVRASNTSAIEFYRKLGFEKGRVVPAYYSDSEDAIILKRTI